MSHRSGYGQRRFVVTPEAIEAWMINGKPVETNLPDDARFVRLWATDDGRGYTVVFESAEWDELAEGELIPEHKIEIHE